MMGGIMRILAINIGNSRAAAGWYADGEIVRARRGTALSAAMLGGGGEAPDGIGVASVVPARNAAVRKLLKAHWPGVPVRWVGPGLDLGIPFDLKAPEKTGADRYADAVAAAELYGTPAIACDFGTATTFNLVLPKRGFCGGVIAPGYGMWFDALGRGAAQLPRLRPGGLDVPTGRNTEEALRLGARWGYRGMVTEILWQLSKACGKKSPYLVATGGHAETVLRDAGFEIDLQPDLTLWGIAHIAERNL